MNHRYVTCLFAGPILFAASAASAQAQPLAENHIAPAVAAPKNEVPSTSRWQTSFYGFVEFDAMQDSTQSFGDSPGNNPLLRSDGSRPAYLPVGTDELKGAMYGATHGRLQATARNSRFGFKMSAPEYAGMKATGVLEVDLFGNQPSYSPGTKAIPATSEASFFTNAALRIRHAYVKVESDAVDVLVGQYYNLFGWQPNFFPGTLSFLGTPNMIFGRTPQIRLSKTIKSDAVNFEIAGAATRPPQRDSSFPGLEGGLRLEANHWRGPHGRGSGQPTLDGFSLGVSAVMRKFRVNAFSNNNGDLTQSTDVSEAGGLGYSFDALIPVIPIKDIENRSGGLILTGSFVTGQGIADLYTGGLTGGAAFPLPEGPGGPSTGFFAGNIDPGLVQYRLLPDGRAELRVVKWQSAMVGFQFYLGKFVFTGNYARAKSPNLGQSIAEGGDPARTFEEAQYYDGNLFADITPSVRGALSYQVIRQKFVNGPDEKNNRIEIGGLFFF